MATLGVNIDHVANVRQARRAVEPDPVSYALLAELGIAPRAAAGEPLGPDDERFSPLALGHLTHRLAEVKRMLEQLGVEQKELQEALRLAHLRGDLLHLQRPSDEGGGYQLPEGPVLHRRFIAARAASSGATAPSAANSKPSSRPARRTSRPPATLAGAIALGSGRFGFTQA